MKPLRVILIAAALLLAVVVFYEPILNALFLPEFVKENDRASLEWSSADQRSELELLPAGSLTRVSASINGVDGFTFLLDTGAGTTMLVGSPKLDRLNLTKQGTFDIGGTGGGVAPVADIAQNVDLTFGSVTIADMSPLVVGWEELPFFVDAESIFFDGVIGYDLFQRVRAEVDFGAGTVVLRPPGPRGTDMAPDVDLTLIRRGRDVYTTIEVQAKQDSGRAEGQFHVDTGSNGVTLIAENVPGVELPTDGPTRPAIGVQGTDGAAPITLFRLFLDDDEVVGPLRASLQRATSADAAMGSHGRVGGNVFSRYRHVIDYSAGLLWLYRTDRSDAPYSLGFTGLAAFPSREGFRVVRVDEASPAADAGLTPGDTIVAVAGRQATQLDMDAWVNTVSELAPGESVELCVQTQSEPNCFQLAAQALP